MTIFLVLSFVRWDGAGGFAFHIIVGCLCVVFFSLHILIHRKWIKATSKAFFTGKIKKAQQGKFIIDMLLLLVWVVSIITGFIAIGPFLNDTAGELIWGRLHGISARLGLVLVIIHAAQHIPQIKSYFSLKQAR